MSTQNQFGDPRTVEIIEANSRDRCCFCGREEVNAVEWGSLLKLGNIVTHHFCLLFSANVEQKGTDHQGIQAFLPADILRELKRGKRLKCKFCKKVNATIGCGVAACRFSYHYPCGYEKGCLFQFHGQFQSYCSNPKHRPMQKIPPGTDSMCSICFVETDPEEAVWPPCCGKQLFHRTCIMHAAKAAGYFFKCPLCNSKEPTFTQAMKANGVYVPEQDAAWETEPNAFQELMQHYSQCDAKPCICPEGRGFETKDSKDWCLIRCEGCGSSATHMKCSGLDVHTWKCEGCVAVLETSGVNSTTGNAPISASSTDESDAEGNSPTSDSSDESSDEEEVIEKLPSITQVINNNLANIDASIEEVVNNFSAKVSKNEEKGTEETCDNNRTVAPPPRTSQIVETENGHDMEQNEDEKMAEKKRFETLQAFMTSKSLERKALRSMNRSRDKADMNPLEMMETLNLLGSSAAEIRKLPPIPRYSKRGELCPNNEPLHKESALNIGREIEMSGRPFTIHHYHQRLMEAHINPHPNTSTYRQGQDNHFNEPNPNLTRLGSLYLQEKSTSTIVGALESSEDSTASIQERLLRIAGNYHSSPNSNSTSTKVKRNSSKSNDMSNQTKEAKLTEVKYINLDTGSEDSADEVTEIIPVPVEDPDIVIDKIIPAPRIKDNTPRSAALKALQDMNLRMKTSSTFPQSYAARLLLKPIGTRRSSNPEVITLDDDEIPGRTGRVKIESVWNEVDSYHGSSYASFQNLPHDYWLNSNALNFINKEYSNELKLNGDHSHSVGSTLLLSTSNSSIDVTQQKNAGQHYSGSMTRLEEKLPAAAAGASQSQLEYSNESSKRPRLS